MRIVAKLGKIFLGLMAVISVAAVYLWYGRLPIDWFFNRALVQMTLESPETLSQLRFLESVGIKFHQDELDDASLEVQERQIKKIRAIHAELRSYERADLTEQQKITYDMADWFLARMLAAADRFRFHNYPVNQLFGEQNAFPSFMEATHQIHGVRDADDYLARLSKVGVKWAQMLEGLKVREQKRIIPPTFVIEKVLAEMRAFVATPAKDNILYVSLAKKLREAKLDQDEQKRILASAQQRIEGDVYPAYETLIAYFAKLQPKSNQDAGVWKLPEGDAFYADILELHTTSTLTPDKIHALGLSEVARIQAEMRSVLTSQGYDGTRPLGDLIRGIAEEPRFAFSDDAAGRQQILAQYTTIIDEVSRGLGKYFKRQPKLGVEVERVPVFKEKTAPGAYYNPPPFDGSKSGVFYANLYDIRATPKFGMRTLAYHEAVPGHHMQIALAQEQSDLPLFRRMAPFTAYTEGWALYAERLAWEVGFQKDPFDNLGRLQAELMRAVRLVVDTGLHKKRWTREQTIDYMAANTGLAMTDVVAEVERYIVMPGQACSYKLGMLELLRLRENAKAQLGSRFDLREFHDVVLRNGAMPLFILERVVKDWIDETKSKVS